jgi:hypothetical protein
VVVGLSTFACRELQARPNPWPPRPFPWSVLPLVVPPQPARLRAISGTDAATAKRPIFEIFIVFLVFLKSVTQKSCLPGYCSESPTTEMEHPDIAQPARVAHPIPTGLRNCFHFPWPGSNQRGHNKDAGYQRFSNVIVGKHCCDIPWIPSHKSLHEPALKHDETQEPCQTSRLHRTSHQRVR